MSLTSNNDPHANKPAIKVVFVIADLIAGGAEVVMARLVSHYPTDEVKVVTLATIGPIGQQLVDQGYEVTNMGLKPHNFLVVIWRLWRYLRVHQPQTVHTWLYHADFIGGVAAKLAGVKSIVWSIRGSDLSVGGKINAIIARFNAVLSHVVPTKITVVADLAKTNHINMGYNAEKMMVIKNGVDTHKFKPDSSKRQQIRQQWQWNDADVIVASIGRYGHVKGQDVFLEAAVIAIQTAPQLKFALVGHGNNADNAELSQLIQSLGLSAHVYLCDAQNDVPAYLNGADIFCMPSRSEGYPNALIEAMSTAKPCIATRVGDTESIVNGMVAVVDIESPNAMARAMVNYASYSEEERNNMGLQLREYISQQYSIEGMFDAFKLSYASEGSPICVG